MTARASPELAFQLSSALRGWGSVPPRWSPKVLDLLVLTCKRELSGSCFSQFYLPLLPSPNSPLSPAALRLQGAQT